MLLVPLLHFQFMFLLLQMFYIMNEAGPNKRFIIPLFMCAVQLDLCITKLLKSSYKIQIYFFLGPN